MQYHAITLVLPFVWVPQFEIKKAENIVFISTKHHLRGKISRSRETDRVTDSITEPFHFHYPLSIRTGGVERVCKNRIYSIGIEMDIILRDSKFFEISWARRRREFGVTCTISCSIMDNNCTKFIFYSLAPPNVCGTEWMMWINQKNLKIYVRDVLQVFTQNIVLNKKI